jgi:hypothetical protein
MAIQTTKPWELLHERGPHTVASVAHDSEGLIYADRLVGIRTAGIWTAETTAPRLLPSFSDTLGKPGQTNENDVGSNVL